MFRSPVLDIFRVVFLEGCITETSKPIYINFLNICDINMSKYKIQIKLFVLGLRGWRVFMCGVLYYHPR
jgi:hypothetical protein